MLAHVKTDRLTVSNITRLLKLMVCALVLTACGARPPLVELGALMFSDSFDAPDGWDQYDSGDIQVVIENGSFRFDVPSGGYYLSRDGREHTDIILEVTARILSDDRSNGVGIICRAQPDGDGYYFLIGNDGSATIRRGQDREADPLVAWTRTNAVRTGNASNTLRAACIGQTLALWVNGEFIGSTTDPLYSSGQTGLVGVTTRRGDRLAVDFSGLYGYTPAE